MHHALLQIAKRLRQIDLRTRFLYSAQIRFLKGTRLSRFRKRSASLDRCVVARVVARVVVIVVVTTAALVRRFTLGR